MMSADSHPYEREFIDILRRMLEIVGHTPEEIERHSQDLRMTILRLAVEETVKSLAPSVRTKLQENLSVLTQHEDIQQVVMRDFFEDKQISVQFLPALATNTEFVVGGYIKMISPNLSPEQNQSLHLFQQQLHKTYGRNN